MSVFRTNIKIEDPAYRNIRDGNHRMEIFGRELTEFLWLKFEPLSDLHFVEQLAIDFDARFWEMDLTVGLIEQGHDVSCPKPGPDVCVGSVDGNLWFEAIAPQPGKGADKVPEIVPGIAQDVPDEQIVLRYTSAIEEKFRKYNEYVEKGIISKTEPYVIAINGCQLPSARADFDPPRIIRSVFPIGGQFVTFDRKTGGVVDSGFNFKAAVKKAKGADVSIDYFLQPKYAGISAILFSCSDCCNRVTDGNDWIVIHNPLATNPLPPKLVSCHREYVANKIDQETYELQHS